MPSPGIFSTGLPSRQPGGAAGPGAVHRSAQVVATADRRRLGGAGGLDDDQRRSAPREQPTRRPRVELVQQLERERPQAASPCWPSAAHRRVGLPAGGHPPVRTSRRRPCPRRRTATSSCASRSGGWAQVSRSSGASSDSRPGALAQPARSASRTTTARHVGHRAPAGASSIRLRRPTSSCHASRHDGAPAEGAADRAGHGRDRVGVAAVVHGAEHRVAVVAVGEEDEPERHRQLLDGLRRGWAVARPSTAAGTPGPPCRTARRPPAARRVALLASRCDARADSQTAAIAAAVPSCASAEPLSMTVVDGGVRRHGGRDPGGEARPPPRGRSSTGAGQARSIASAYARAGAPALTMPDRSYIHRGTAVDDVADAGLAWVDVAVVQSRDEPLLREEEPLQQQRIGSSSGTQRFSPISSGTRSSATA